MHLNPRLVKESFSAIEPVAKKAVAYFYGRLFAENPHLRGMFPPAMDLQRDRLFKALTRIVWSLDSPDGLSSYLRQLGQDHRKYGVAPEHYTAIGNALLATVRRFAADQWTAETEAAWVAAYTLAANIMIEAAEAGAEFTPPWWTAEVVDHQRRTSDIAVLTLRPATRLNYLPGQYLSVQTPRWPRVWRPYSIANAPRPDNTIRLHVRAVPGGWVSSTLVSHTAVGDTLLLGPPVGTMRPPLDSGREILAVAGGTGLAPLKAIIEHLIVTGRGCRMRLLHGTRRTADLYDMPDLLRMASVCPSLEVIPVVAEEPGPGFRGWHGGLVDAMERLRPGTGHEVYLCGPPAMVGEAAQRLQRRGVPPERIHRDAAPEEH